MVKKGNAKQDIIYNSIVKIISNTSKVDLKIPYKTSEQGQSIGTGFFFDKQGHILTAAHVIEDSVEIWLNMPKYGKKIFKASIVAVYPDFDIGIIKIINFKNDCIIHLGNSDEVKLRDNVYVIGYPNNPDYPIITSGTISGSRTNYIQTDTPVNSGNSGGPLLNNKNKVIGITSAVIKDSENSSLITPINIFKENIKYILSNKKKIIYKNVLGVLLVNSTDNYKQLYGSSKQCKEGILVKKVLKKSPLKGLMSEGDVICSINNGKKVYSLDYYGEANEDEHAGKVSLSNIIKRCKPNQTISLKYWSINKKKIQNATINLKTFEQLYPVNKLFQPLSKIDYEIYGGMILMNLSTNHLSMPEFRHLLYIIKNQEIYNNQLIITHIFPSSKISEYGSISEYTLVKKVNNKPVNSLASFRNAIKTPIISGRNKFFIIETTGFDKVILNLDEIQLETNKIKKNYFIK
jgi:S1-C subfamily serine protease